MTVIAGSVVGAERVIVDLSTERPAKARENVALSIRESGFMLERKVKLEKLMGQVLHRRSGRLARSINTKYQETATTFTSSTGTRLSYGRAWELGFHGLVQVREYTRKSTGARVRAHMMQMNMTARPFLRPALAEMRLGINERLRVAALGLSTEGFDPKFSY